MKKELRVLCLEDNVEDYELIVHTLNKSFALVPKRVDTREDYAEALLMYMPQLILSDHALPQFNSLEALSLKHKAASNIPFILVTGAVSDEFAVTCLKKGADDYVLKDNLKALPAVVVNALKAKEEVIKRETFAKELEAHNQELSKVNRDLDSFIYSMSHNLRSPLSSMQGLINLCKEEQDMAIIRQYHEMLEKSIQKLDKNLIEVLEYARNSKQELLIEQVNLEDLVNENFDRMMHMDGTQGMKKEITLERCQAFYSDKFRVSSIMNNLISNAIKYKKPERDLVVRISIDITALEARVRFEDNGIGIPRPNLDRIFDMFYRATDIKTGTGLGLHIVREAVNAIKGSIKVESLEGHGTTFTLVLPNYQSS